MSVSALTWAYAQHVCPPTHKFVLVTLAWYAADDTLKAWPSISALCKDTGLARRLIFYALSELKRLGFIEVAGRIGITKQINVYQLKGASLAPLKGATDALFTPERVQPVHRKGANGASSPLETPSLGTDKEHPPLSPPRGNGQLLFSESETRKTKAAKSSEPSEDFLQFWREYPRHVAMKAAWKAWEKARPPLSIVLESLAEHKKTDQWRRGKEYVPHASTFINQERWDDEL